MEGALALVRRFLDAENRRDWTEWGQCLHPEVEYEMIGGDPVVRGREHYIQHMQRIYEELSDWKFRIVTITGDETTVTVEFDGTGHFTGRHEAQEYRGAPLRLRAVCVFELREGLIRRGREYFDHRSYEAQLKAANRVEESSTSKTRRLKRRKPGP